MEGNVLQKFNAGILEEATRLFAVEVASATLLSDVENFVYACQGEKEPIVLRITHRSHREAPAIQGELEWMTHLYEGGVPLVLPLHSINGKLIEQVGSGEAQFAVTAFPKLSGQPILDTGECTPDIYQQWGSVMGRIHTLSKTYHPSDPSFRRSAWFENDAFINAEDFIPGQTIILDKLHRLMDKLLVLPQDADSYGLVHGDLTDVNFFVHDHHIAVFDFDNSEYHWFVYDIAIVLFDGMPFMPRMDMDEESFGRYFWKHFYGGYKKENVVDDVWLERLPQFMKLNQIYTYIWSHKKRDMDNLKEGEQRWLAKVRENIENDIPCLKFDITQ